MCCFNIPHLKVGMSFASLDGTARSIVNDNRSLSRNPDFVIVAIVDPSSLYVVDGTQQNFANGGITEWTTGSRSKQKMTTARAGF